MATKEKGKFDARREEGVAYFEQMLAMMPDDRTTLEFLSVVYPQMGEQAKAEHALAELARVLVKEGDSESALALLPRLEECESPAAKAMAVRVKALGEPKPELVPEAASTEPAVPPAAEFARAVEAEALLAESLGEAEVAAHLRSLPDNDRLFLVSALATMARERPDACEPAIARLADAHGCPPVPLDAFEPDREAAGKLGERLVKLRGAVPFARLAGTSLVAVLNPGDEELRRAVTDALGEKVRFYLADPQHVEAAVAKLWPEEVEGA